MRARFLAEDPGSIEMTMKISMPLKDWIELRDQIQNGWPGTSLASHITSMIIQAQKIFYSQEVDPDAP